MLKKSAVFSIVGTIFITYTSLFPNQALAKSESTVSYVHTTSPAQYTNAEPGIPAPSHTTSPAQYTNAEPGIPAPSHTTSPAQYTNAEPGIPAPSHTTSPAQYTNAE
ncbi:hypothetical protein ACQKMZ_28225, partial [Bacillus paramycoides]|uniref:hypothetical protein n=1 Tax=Bacillus paramycoides TaxID=2026194 RepID=UPI003D04B971